MRVRLEEVTHFYERSEESAEVQVLDRVSLQIASGDFAAVMGASGSGKSTLLNLIGAVDRPSAGRVFLGDTDTSLLREPQLTAIRRRSIGFVFQFSNLLPTLTVQENVAFPLWLLKTPRREVDARVKAALEEVAILHRARHYPNELSGGEMQRAALARAVVHRPALILADEPTGNLDSKNGTAVLELLASLHREHRPTLVMATHSDRAASYADYIVRISDGQIQR
ncbi:MAG TPA: ABC transporter ATP-binding protein [Thermoanaerobaculia bacterium]|nr:ABC transporter ATP-binding protein [Thermoanaerobaculia bacterium]